MQIIKCSICKVEADARNLDIEDGYWHEDDEMDVCPNCFDALNDKMQGAIEVYKKSKEGFIKELQDELKKSDSDSNIVRLH